MLFFIGLGVEQSPTLRAVAIMKSCERIFYESYTSPVIDGDVMQNLTDSTDRKIEAVSRDFVEDGRKILEPARSSRVALVSSGDPMIATTHQELRTRALTEKIETQIVHGSSVLSSVIGELGLHSYSFGKNVTMTKEPMQHTAYLTIYQNLLRQLHTLILLEWDESSRFFLSPKDALSSLLEAENDLKYGAISGDTLILSASEIGSDRARMSANFLHEALDSDYGKPPHVLVVPGRLHFTEKESLSALTGKEPGSLPDNSQSTERIAHRMLSKYSQKTLSALERARAAATAKGKANLESLFENVEAYTQDAIRFLNEGKEELAVLSMGYAEGLLDSLRFSAQLEFEW
ncbi:MAG: diphthine synthase [Nitrososphaerales archaeon]